MGEMTATYVATHTGLLPHFLDYPYPRTAMCAGDYLVLTLDPDTLADGPFKAWFVAKAEAERAGHEARAARLAWKKAHPWLARTPKRRIYTRDRRVDAWD